MGLGKTIRLFLIDGTSSGPITAEVINWTGHIVVVPRSQLHEMAKREELRRKSVRKPSHTKSTDVSLY